MTNTYNTGNPLGSTDARDLYDNASNMDEGMNSGTPSFTDRLGVLRKTWNGLEAEFDLAQAGRETQFQNFLVASGFVSLGNYAAGMNFTLYNQYMARAGFFYRPAPSSIPFTTTGTWVGGDENLFVLLSADDVLRQDLANDTDPAKGAAIVGRADQVANSIAALRLLDKTAASKHAFVSGYYVQGDGGGGAYYLDQADTTSADNGGTVIVASDGARWKLQDKSIVSIKQFGAKGDGIADDTIPIQAALDLDRQRILFQPGTYKITSTLNIGDGTASAISTKNGICLEGHGGGVTTSEFGPAGSNCQIVWAGAAGGTMIKVNGPIYGVNISGISLDCANIANTGVNAKHNVCSNWSNVLVLRYVGDAYVWGAYQTPTAMAVGASDSTYTNVSSKQPGSGGSGAVFGESTGDVGNLDVARNVWSMCEWWRDGTNAATYSAKFQFIDNCTFVECHTTAQGGSLGIGVYALPPTGTGIAGFPAAITFINCPLIGGFSAGPGWLADEGFLFWPYPVGDGEPIPESVTSKQVYGITTKGDYFGGFSIGAGNAPIKQHTSVSAPLSFGSIGANSTIDRAVSVSIAEVGDTVVVAPVEGVIPAGLVLFGFVDAATNVIVRWANITTGAVTAPSVNYRVDVWKH